MKTRKFKKSVIGGITLAAFAATALTLSPVISHTAYADTHEVIGGNYFLSDYDNRSEVLSAGTELNKEIAGEGTVLLKNENNALPLAGGNKISLFGKNAYTQMNGFAAALRSEGFQTNGSLENFYNNNTLSGTGAPARPGIGTVLNGLPIGESDISKFNDSSNSIAAYNDAAVVTFYRMAGEGFELPFTMQQVDGSYTKYGTNTELVPGARAKDDHYLQLDANETALLEYCAEHFDKIIVIVNSSSPLELGFLDDPGHYAFSDKIQAALWTCAAQTASYTAIARILKGEINPSGHLPDTWARDFKADPTWNNFANNFMEDYSASGSTVYAKGNQYDNVKGSGGNGGGGYVSNYVYYKEGIYSAYRYWETRGYTEGDEAWSGDTPDTLARYAHGPNEAIHGTTTTEWDNWYDAHVVYPFGYGLSYTDFAWTLDGITETPDANGKITAQVTVKNTGSVAGKDVVQLYYSAPYIQNQIEKSQVVLGAFAKTKLLQPNESDTVTLEFAVRDMASYDYNDANGNEFRGYELDAGEYDIYIGKNAHCWADADVLKKSYTLSAAKYETDEVTGYTVENRFDEVSGQLLREDRYPEDDGNDEKDLYMTRTDWSGTWPTMSYRLTAEQWIIDGVKTYNEDNTATCGQYFPEDKETDPWYNNDPVTTGAKYETPVKLNELFGLDYDDPLWDKFLDQLTADQLEEIALQGRYKSGIDIPELGVKEVINADGPNHIGIANSVYLPKDILTAATWNEELAYRKGNIIGNNSLWGDGQSADSRVPGWYAPAVNLHRNPFGGRVGEYFSEDGVLTGKLGAQIVIGAQEKGLFCYVKHFAVNNQETNRCGLLTWANEQCMREVYFPAFEICVKEGKAIGIMTALNRLGPNSCGGSYALLTEVLRNEWGFRGNVVTDSASGAYYNADIFIRSGGSLILGTNKPLHISPRSNTTLNCLRESTHGVLYAHANSMALNTGETPTVPKKMRRFDTKSLEIGMIDVDYSADISDCIVLNTEYYPTANKSEVKFSLSETSSLPRGLTLSEDGIISGKPKTEARIQVHVTATYGDETLTQSFTIIIIGEGGAIIYDTQDKALSARVGESFTGSVAKAYIYDPYATPEEIANYPSVTYSIANGSLLPEGLTLDIDGTVTGTPTKECRDYKFTVVASALGYSETDLTFTISALYKLDYSAADLASASYGKSYVAAVNTAVCDKPVKYALKAGDLLPAGLTLTEGGYIVGTPDEACTKTFTVIASADYADPVEATFTLNVDPKFDSATTLPNGKVGVAYIGSVDTAQGSFDLTYKLVGGALPAGLTLGQDGTISGTPTASGTYTVIVRAEDGELSDEITLNLFVDNAGSITTVIKGEKDAAKPAAIALGVTTGVFATGFAAMTALYVLGRKKR